MKRLFLSISLMLILFSMSQAQSDIQFRIICHDYTNEVFVEDENKPFYRLKKDASYPNTSKLEVTNLNKQDMKEWTRKISVYNSNDESLFDIPEIHKNRVFCMPIQQLLAGLTKGETITVCVTGIPKDPDMAQVVKLGKIVLLTIIVE